MKNIEDMNSFELKEEIESDGYFEWNDLEGWAREELVDEVKNIRKRKGL